LPYASCICGGDWHRFHNSMHILDQSGHSFLRIPDSCSCLKRTTIPVEFGHGFLRKTDTAAHF
ncbi:MAG: hypothetical protein ACOCYF_02665, partial [Bacteroidota bacterium]